jgi:predicted glycoside hydrolase/deacetylase ChbG (UPF0249 family)
MKARQIALCVDDFGLHAGVNQAVISLATLRRLNAVSCLVGAPAWASGSPALADLDTGVVDVGLHLDLTDMPLHADTRSSLPGLILRAAAHRLPQAPLRAEIEAQLDAFELHLKRPPDHVDGHRHVHQLPVVRELLVEILQRRYPARRPWLRCTRNAGWRVPFAFKAGTIAALGSRGLAQLALARGYAQNARLLGVHDFAADASGYRRLLSAWLRAARDGDLLMCHPSVPIEASGDTLMAARAAEWTVLHEAGFAATLEAEQIELAPISRLRAPG